MSNQELVHEIANAIGAHGMWKLKLRTAIATGAKDMDAREICRDDACAFGHWLHGPA